MFFNVFGDKQSGFSCDGASDDADIIPPCPYCKSKNTVIMNFGYQPNYSVVCEDCGSHGPLSVLPEDEDFASRSERRVRRQHERMAADALERWSSLADPAESAATIAKLETKVKELEARIEDMGHDNLSVVEQMDA